MNPTALITGASSGIGYEFAKVFAKNGYNLVLVARREDRLKKLAEELKHFNIFVLVLPYDLNMPDAPQKIFNDLKNKNIHIDTLVNNAGFALSGAFAETKWIREEEMIQVNITALTFLTKLFLPNMIKAKKGSILNVASTAAFQSGPFMSVYYATKAYVLSFTEALYEELKGTGVSVTALCPGPTASNFESTAQAKDTHMFKRRRIPSSKEVAEFGFKAMNSKLPIAIHGIMNKVMAQSVRFSPRFVVRKIVRSLQMKRLD